MSDLDSSAEFARWAAFGCAAVFVFGALSIARHGARRVWRVGLYGLASLAAFALLARPRLLPSSGSDFAILWTAGADPDGAAERVRELRSQQPAAAVRLAPGAEAAPGNGGARFERLGRWQELGLLSATWRLVGPGFLPAEVRALPPGLRWVADGASAPDGLTELQWPRSIPLGRDLVVTGRFHRGVGAKGGRLALRGPGGVESHVEIDPDGGFRIAARPRAIGRSEVLLESVDLAPSPEPRLEARLDFTVELPTFPRVRIVASRANPDAAALRRWLARRGAEVELSAGLSDGIEAEVAIGEESENGSPTVTVVFGSQPPRSWTTLAAENLILVGEEALRSRRGRPAPRTDHQTIAAMALHATSDQRIGVLSLGPSRLSREEVAEPLWYDEAGAILAGVLADSPDDSGVVVSLVDASFRYPLRGDPESYAKLWSRLLEAAARLGVPHCVLADGPIVDGDPLRVVCRGARSPGADLGLTMETPDGGLHELALRAHPFEPERFETEVWPRGDGWHRLIARQGDREHTLEFRARPRAAWASWDAERRRQATALLGEAHADGSPPAPRHPLPTIWILTVLLLALGALWGVERSGA